MDIVLHVVHILSALALIGLIMIQQGKGADAGASFGGGGSQTVFGSAGSGNFLTRATAMLAVVFMVTSLGLAWMARQGSTGMDATRAVLETLPQEELPAADIPEVVELEGDVPTVPDAMDDGLDVPVPEETPAP